MVKCFTTAPGKVYLVSLKIGVASADGLVEATGVMSSQVGIVEGLVTNNRYPEVKLGHIRDTYPRPVAPNFVTGSVRSGVLSFSVQ